MAKIIDITDKLNFEQKPQIKIKDTVLTVNDEAVALLEILPKLNGNVTPETISDMCNILFDESEMQKLKKLKLNFEDFTTLVQSALKPRRSEQNSSHFICLKSSEYILTPYSDKNEETIKSKSSITVSYTHLTLPTILLV